MFTINASDAITSDDDVAVIFDPEGKVALSEALVNIDYKLNLATEEEIITKYEKDEIIKVTKEIYYPKRTYPYILQNPNLTLIKKKN